jgi:hypothetical protein
MVSKSNTLHKFSMRSRKAAEELAKSGDGVTVAVTADGERGSVV